MLVAGKCSKRVCPNTISAVIGVLFALSDGLAVDPGYRGKKTLRLNATDVRIDRWHAGVTLWWLTRLLMTTLSGLDDF